MNYFGKLDAKVSDAPGQHPSALLYSETVHANHVPADAVVVPDAQLLFSADFKRAGVDLVLSGEGREVVLHDYFKGEHRAAIASSDGAHLTGDLVAALAGEVQYAQADGNNTDAHKVIGHVTKQVGTATAVRNGVSIILNNGDNVEKGDVVSSGSDSTLGITFIDGTVFGLSANARMVLNEMVYDPNGSNNSSLLSLVAGTITFVAGETAKHGDMKVDTPVATMGIRGTAVLVEIDFSVPGATPDAKFQVLVEPDGTTGSYILFDKTTLTPLAVVDRAGTQINISNGIMSQTLAPLSPEIQKLINDVFTLKFSDNTNTKSLDHFTDSIVPTDVFLPFKFAGLNNNAPMIPVIVNLVVAESNSSGNGASSKNHIPEAPSIQTGPVVASITEQPNQTGLKSADFVGGQIQYFDVNTTDHDTLSVKFSSFTYQNAKGQDVTSSLNSLQLKDIAQVEATIGMVEPLTPDGNGNATGTWSYSVADKDFDFLAKGETLTLTYTATVDNNYQPLDQVSVPQTFTITITGTNDVPVITTSQENFEFAAAGTGTQGGALPVLPSTATTGTLNFTDADLTDTHTASAQLVSALLNGQGIEGTTVGQTVFNELASALTAVVQTDSTGTGGGTIQWTLADLQVFLADFVPANESLVLTYAVTVTDSQGATATQDVVFTIDGNEPAATVWTDTTPLSQTDGVALWSDAANWETGKAPSTLGTDDVIISNDQVSPKTPTFPVTVAADAAAKSLTMNDFADFSSAMPTLDVESNVTLAIGGALNLNTGTDPITGDSLPLTAEVIINNWGTITVGGIAELLKSSALNNHGTITLAQGGDFADQSSITNSGTIEVAGSTLNVDVDIANSFITTVDDTLVTTPGTIQVDTKAALLLDDGGGIIGGNLTIASIVEITYGQDGTASANGAVLDGVEVTNDGTIQVDGAVTADPTTTPATLATPAATLTLDDGTTIKGGNLTIADGATVDVESGVVGPGATLDGVTVTGIDATESVTASTIEVGKSGAATLSLDDGTTIINGNLTIDSGSTLDVEAGKTGPGATLDGVTVTGIDAAESITASTIEVGQSGAATLLLDDGTIITHGDLTIAGGSTLDVEAGTTDPGATLDGVTVTGTDATESATASTIEVGASSPATLLLDDGTTITNGNLTISADSAVDVEAGTIGPGATLDGVAVGGTGGDNPSTIAIGGSGSAATLVLDGGTTITNGNLSIAGGSTLDVEAGTAGPGATLDGVVVSGTDADAELSAPASVIDVGISGAATLLLDDGTSITNGNLTIASGSTVDVESVDGTTLDGVTVSGTNDPSTIEIGKSGVSTLLLDDGTTITNGNLTIGGGSTLDVEAATSGPGAILDGVAVSGTSGDTPSIIEVGTLGAATLLLDDGTTITNGNLNIIGASTLDIEAGKTGPGATLDDVTVNGTNAIDLIAASTIEVGKSGAATLTLDGGATISNGNLTIAGGSTLDVESTVAGGPSATLDGVNVEGSATSTIEIGATTATGATLLLDGGTTITNGNLTIAGGSTVEVTYGQDGTASANSATLDGVQVINDGTIQVDGAVAADPTATPPVHATPAATLTLDDGTIITHGDLTIASGSTLDVEAGATGPGATLDGVNVNGTNDPSTIEIGELGVATLLLDDGTTITNGNLNIAGGSTLDIEAGTTGPGATLDGVAVSGTNATESVAASTIEVGATASAAATLTLKDGTTITDGSLTIATGSSLDIENSTTGIGATLNDVSVTNDGTIQIDAGVNPTTTVTLVLENGTSITNGSLEIHVPGAADEGVAEIAAGDVTFDNVTVADNSLLQIDALATLTIDDGTTIDGGMIDDAGTLSVTASSEIENDTINGGGDVTVTGGTLTLSGVTLDDVTLAGSFTNADTLTIDDTVTLNGATLSGGTIDDTGTLKVSSASEIENATVDGGGDLTATAAALTMSGVTLDDVTLAGSFINADTLTIDDTVTLNGATISGGTIDDTGTLKVSSASEIENATVDGGGDLAATAAALTMSGVTLDDVTLAGSFTNTDTLTIDDAVTLNGATISGGTIDDAGTISGYGAISSVVTGSGALTASGGTLTLTGVNTYSGTTTINGTLVLSGAGSIADSNGVVDDGTFDISGLTTSGTSIVTLSGTGTVDLGGKTLTLSDASTTFSGAIDGSGGLTLTSGTETLSGNNLYTGVTTINGTLKLSGAGSIADSDGVVDDGTFDISGLTTSGTSIVTLSGTGTVDLGGKTLTLSDASTTFNGTISSAGGEITVSGGTLTLGTMTLDDVTLAGSFDNSGTMTIDDIVTLNGATLSGGTLDVSGTLDSVGTSFITGSTIVNAGHINVVSGTLTIDPAPFTNTGTVEVDSKANLVVSGETVTNSVTVGLTTTNGTVQVDSQGLLTLNGTGDTINGGIVDNLGTIDVKAVSSINNTFSFTNTGIVNADGAALTLSGTTVTNAGGTLESTGTGLIDLVNATVSNGALSGKITTGIGNSSSTLNGLTLELATLVTATVGVLELTGVITNNGEIDANAGTVDLVSSTLDGGTLGGTGKITTVGTSLNTLDGVTISHGTTVKVADNTALDLKGTITDSGTIALGSSGHSTQLEISGSVSLTGGGAITMSDVADTTGHVDNFIVGDGSAATLTNSDTISGAGTIGDSNLTLINSGTIDATGTHSLVIATGVTNNSSGILEASAGSELDINGNVVNNGTIEANGASSFVKITGNVTNTAGSTGAIDISTGGHVEITGSVSAGQAVTFEQANEAGLLTLDDSHAFAGTIAGLSEASTESAENHVDLVDLAYRQGSMSAHYSSTTHEVTFTNNFTHDSVSLLVSGSYSAGSFEFGSDGHGGTLIDDPSVVGTMTIDSGQTLDLSVASSATVNFTNSSGNTGELLLDDSHDFTGTIAGFAGDGTTANSDLIDATDINFANVATNETTYTENANGTGTLTLYNAAGQALDSINFDGNYQLANFTIENDGNGGTLIVDPPVNTNSQPPANTIVASAPNQTLTGSAPSEKFVFNFANVGHSTIANFDPTADTVQFSGSMFANVQSILNAVHDDGHGNSVIAIDAHDSITLHGVAKAQLHAGDFHIV